MSAWPVQRHTAARRLLGAIIQLRRKHELASYPFVGGIRCFAGDASRGGKSLTRCQAHSAIQASASAALMPPPLADACRRRTFDHSPILIPVFRKRNIVPGRAREVFPCGGPCVAQAVPPELMTVFRQRRNDLCAAPSTARLRSRHETQAEAAAWQTDSACCAGILRRAASATKAQGNGRAAAAKARAAIGLSSVSAGPGNISALIPLRSWPGLSSAHPPCLFDLGRKDVESRHKAGILADKYEFHHDFQPCSHYRPRACRQIDLFNRLWQAACLGLRSAGVTRDRRHGAGDLRQAEFNIIDSPPEEIRAVIDSGPGRML